jgi:hypothetical protein
VLQVSTKENRRQNIPSCRGGLPLTAALHTEGMSKIVFELNKEKGLQADQYLHE